MRVLFIGECPWIPSSLGKVTYYTVKGLQERGYDVVVACLAGFNTLKCRGWEYDGIKVYPYGDPMTSFVRMVGADVVIIYGTPYSPPGASLVKEAEKVISSFPEVRVIGYFLNESLYLAPIYGLTAVNTHAIVTPSKFVADTFRRSFVLGGFSEDVLADRFFVVPHGVDTRVWFKRDVGKIPGEFVYGMFGKNMVRKHFGVLIQAQSLLPEEVRRNARVLIGKSNPASGGESWTLDAFKQVFGVGDEEIYEGDPYAVTFGYPEEELVKYLSRLDVHAFMTIGEAFGIPVIETGAMGIPQVVTDIPVMREILGDAALYVKCEVEFSMDGLAFCYPRASDLAEKLVKLYEDKGLRVSLGSKAKEVAERYSWERVARGFETVIETVTSSPMYRTSIAQLRH